MNTSLTFSPWSSGQTYSKFDVIWGVNQGDLNYYYSTVDNNVGCFPSGGNVNIITGISRSNDVATVYYSPGGFFEGNRRNYTVGSLIQVYNPHDTSFNYTGMAIGGGSGFAKYISAGWDTGGSVPGFDATVVGYVHPNWTTGFFYIPSYTTSVETQQAVITAQFEPGYEQRQPQSINNNTDTWNLSFLDRSDKETRAIRQFIQTKGAVYAFPIMIPVSSLDNLPNQMYIGTGPKVTQKSWNINDVSVVVRRVFDPQ